MIHHGDCQEIMRTMEAERLVGIERDEASVEIARRRTAEKHGGLFG